VQSVAIEANCDHEGGVSKQQPTAEQAAALSRRVAALDEQLRRCQGSARELSGSLEEQSRLYDVERRIVEKYRVGLEALLRRMLVPTKRRHGLHRRLWFRWRRPDEYRILADYEFIAKSRQFDAAYYLANNPDLLGVDIDPLLHYVALGAKEGRNPSRVFNTRWYLAAHPDLVAWPRNPLIHYIRHGAAEGRSAVPPEAAESTVTSATPAPAIVAPKRTFDPLRTSLDYHEVPLVRPEREPNMGSLDVHWVIPDFPPGAGGHMTIFRIVRLLAEFGHRQTLWIQNPSFHATPTQARRAMERQFLAVDAELRFLPADVSGIAGDAIIASDRWTAFPVAAMANFFRRFYFVQDYETYFYPAGSLALLTDYTYSLGLDCLSAGPWLDRKMQAHGLWSMAWELAADPAVYFPPPDDHHREQNRIAYYSRITSTRRAVELGLLGLEELARWGYRFVVDLFGCAGELGELSYPHHYHGLLSAAALGDLYRRATIGMVFSSTNYSLVPREMMACGLPVVELDVDSVRGAFPDGLLARAAPHPTAIAERLAELLDDDGKRQRLGDQSRLYQGQFSWKASARLIESALRERIATAYSGTLDDTRQNRGSPHHVRHSRTIGADRLT
jgi:glycosyltransferase involved in cell wall biosynthesis